MQQWFSGKSVALVGNAQSLFDDRHGAAIDDHDVVCRLNRGIIIQDPKSQGHRTDIWAIGLPKFVLDILDIATYEFLIHVSFKGRQQLDSRVDYYLPLDFISHLVVELDHPKPSTGLTMIAAISHCAPKCLSLYGFDWKQTPTWYFKEGIYQPHDWQREKTFVHARFLETGLATLI